MTRVGSKKRMLNKNTKKGFFFAKTLFCIFCHCESSEVIQVCICIVISLKNRIHIFFHRVIIVEFFLKKNPTGMSGGGSNREASIIGQGAYNRLDYRFDASLCIGRLWRRLAGQLRLRTSLFPGIYWCFLLP